MFTGIIESMAEVCAIHKEGTNIRFTFECSFASELKVDQSLAHNGVCLTVVKVAGNKYDVVAIDETLIRTNLGKLIIGDKVNLERCMIMNGRLDGHIVQGHVDTTAKVEKIINEDGSWRIYFSYAPSPMHLTVEKGSVCINGVSLTVVDSEKSSFSVAIIPYTWENTNFHTLKPGDDVNIEFDIIGKYVGRYISITNE
ncbi:MAG TPA: riboflavin synthase [Bacteroidia bacterium]|jgi:riboflavin synthase|nr:riboflavin synthase [Bacteroidota bacterium]MBK7431778.1 riboflavin synthase [Bacteroidota bacterium]MBK8586354.1 riboflavin synthase [Bacteroidota bacterium]HQV99448.1 riboflavin synthase [Bacteroidia bacterium]